MCIILNFFRSQKKKAKKLRQKEAERLENLRELSVQTDVSEDSCNSCSEKIQEITKINETLTEYQNEKKIKTITNMALKRRVFLSFATTDFLFNIQFFPQSPPKYSPNIPQVHPR